MRPCPGLPQIGLLSMEIVIGATLPMLRSSVWPVLSGMHAGDFAYRMLAVRP